MDLLNFERVAFGYSAALPIFNDLSLAFRAPVERGSIVAVLGASGSGKSTLLKLACGIETPTRGEVTLGIDARELALVHQTPVLFEHLSALDNAMYMARTKSHQGMFDAEGFRRAQSVLQLDRVIGGSNVERLSGGERQRLALLRAISVRPKVLLLDEPCAGLDEVVKQDLLQMIRALVDASRALALYVTHHREEAALVADEILHIARREDGLGSHARKIGVIEATDCPPNLEVAKMLLRPGSVLSCAVDPGGTIRALHHDLGRARGIAEGRYDIFFHEEAVVPRQTGLPVDRVGRSARYVFLRVEGGGGVLAMSGFDGARIGLRGRCLFFSAGGGGARKALVEE